MSHNTEIKVEIGLDSYHLHCGVAANQSKTFADDAALAGSKWRWFIAHNPRQVQRQLPPRIDH